MRSPEGYAQCRAGDHGLCDLALPQHGACSECGKTVRVSRSSAAPERRRCRDCQRARPRQLPDRDCVICAATFTPREDRAKYCSRRCANSAPRKRGPTRNRICEICAEAYRASYGDQRTCGRACGLELQRRKGTAGRGGKKREHWPSCKIYVHECAWCGILYIGKVPRSRYCSVRHGWNACNAAKATARPERKCPCGATVPATRYRCNDCKAATRRNRKRREKARRRESVLREPYTLTEIAGRDHFRCGLCRKRVAMTKAVPHPKAPTIDHIVPWSVSKDDSRANVQLAHFLCNSLKSAGGGGEQLLLIG